MQGHKPVQKQWTHLGISANADGCRHSVSADRDSRLLLLHRKCPNPSVCVHSIPSGPPPVVSMSVPFTGGNSPIICQRMTCKPRPRQVASLSENAQIHVAGNAIPSASSELSPSHPAAKQHRLRRHIYAGKSYSADGGSRHNPENPAVNEDILQDKGRNTDIYIPTASSSVRPRPPSGNRKFRDKVVDRAVKGIQRNACFVDIMQHEGGLRMEHVENPRPLPPRDDIPVYNDSSNISAGLNNHLLSRPDSAFGRRCVTDSELCPSRHLVSDQFPNVSHAHSYEQPLRTSLSATNSSPLVCFGDTEQTFCRVSVARKQTPNTLGNRTVCSAHGSLRRCSSVHQVLQSADRRGRRRMSWRKSVADVGETVLCNDGEFIGRRFGSSPQAELPDDSSDRTDSVYIHNKYLPHDAAMLVQSWDL